MLRFANAELKQDRQLKSRERLQTIESILSLVGRVNVVDLAEQFDVAQETIRRDLSRMESDGLLRKIHGGALAEQGKFEKSFAARIAMNAPEKHILAELATQLISPGSTIFLDFGTTAHAFAEHIKSKSDLTVITNSHMTATTLANNSNCEVFMLGGRYDDQEKANFGTATVENIQNFYVDTAVLSIGGIDVETGFTVESIDEAMVARAMISRSSKRIILADPSKYECKKVVRVAEFRQVDYLVSSARPGKEIVASLEQNGVSLVTPLQPES